MSQVFDADTLRREHAKSSDTKTVVLTRCWSVIFDTNGNAPADATVASFATKELADQAQTLFAAQKDDKTAHIVIGGKKHSGLPTYSVEGYGFDTCYDVTEDWQPADRILTSLAGLATLADEESDTTEPDGVLLTEGDDS